MLLTIVAFLFVLSLLVFVHEFGHFAVAKLSGIRVERFSIGMPPRIAGIQIGETDYCLSAIPFGGYVTLTGQSDFENVEEAEDYTNRDYRAKSTPVKIAVLVAGAMMNIITALIIFFFLFWIEGVPETTTKIGHVDNGSLAAEVGLVAGDVISSVNGKNVDELSEVILELYASPKSTIVLKRDGRDVTVSVPRKLTENENFGVYEYYDAKIGTIIPGEPADKAGLEVGDEIVAINDTDVAGWEHMRSVIEGYPDTRVTFTVRRNGALLTLPVEVGHTEREKPDGSSEVVGRVGYTPVIPIHEVGFAQAGVMAVDTTGTLIVRTLDFFIKLVTGRMSAKLLGGPVMIAQLAGESAKTGFSTLMGFTAFISINLGVLNLLPFPVLDGGHIAILLIESATRRRLSTKARMAFQQAGTLFLLLLMLYITFNDIMRFDAISSIFGN